MLINKMNNRYSSAQKWKWLALQIPFLIIVIIGAILRLGLSIHYRLRSGFELVVERTLLCFDNILEKAEPQPRRTGEKKNFF